MLRLPPRPTSTYPPFPYTPPFRSGRATSRNGPTRRFGPLGRPGYVLPRSTERDLCGSATGCRWRRTLRWLPTRRGRDRNERSEEHTSELQSLMRISYAVFCLKKTANYLQTQEKEVTHTYKHR